MIHVARLNGPRDAKLMRSFPAFGIVLGVVPVLIGLTVYLGNSGLSAVWVTEAPRWTFVGAMLLAGASCRLGAFVEQKAEAGRLSQRPISSPRVLHP